MVGDVDPECFEVASAMTPVPGGVGPMTVAMLLKNTCEGRFHFEDHKHRKKNYLLFIFSIILDFDSQFLNIYSFCVHGNSNFIYSQNMKICLFL